jgi:hypothetical protein
MYFFMSCLRIKKPCSFTLAGHPSSTETQFHAKKSQMHLRSKANPRTHLEEHNSSRENFHWKYSARSFSLGFLCF